jgi:hypothetical protein
MLGVEDGKYFQKIKKRGKQGMHLRHVFELAQIACREVEYPNIPAQTLVWGFREFKAPLGGDSNFNGTWAASLNLLGTAVGFSYEADGTTVDGYVRFADGTLILANAPVSGQQSTVAWSINDLNEFTGFWYDANGAEHGFVALAVR